MLDKFIKTCNLLGTDSTLIQGPGGNISFKDVNGRMFIKSSGFCLEEITENRGVSLVDFSKIDEYLLAQTSLDDFELKKENEYSDLLNEIGKNSFKPSMETGFHACLGKIVIHTHPVYLNAILCNSKGEEIINDLFSQYKFHYIPYTAPGYNLSYAISQLSKEKIYFLSNHGLIINCSSLEEGVELTQTISLISKKFLSKSALFIDYLNFKENKEFSKSLKAFYPDSAVFISKKPDYKNPKIKEILKAHNYIEFVNNKILTNGELNYFSDEEIHYLQEMQSEKYRKNLVDRINK